MGSVNTQATRSTLTSVDTTLSENITATQDYIPVASTTNFSTSVVAEIESTNEVVSFTDISENLIIYSEDLTQGYWGKAQSTITGDTSVAPDGTTTADTLTADAGVATFSNVRALGSFTSGVNHTFSVHVKAGTHSFVSLGTNNSFSDGQFNLSNGTVISGSKASIEDKGNGWYRCSVKNLTPGGARAGFIQFCDASGNRTLTFTGSETLLLWGAQMELGTDIEPPTTYLPTNGSALVGLTGVTRGVNGTTAQAASSGDSIQQLPYALGSVDMPVRLRAISVSPDGTGAARLTLCDNNGDTLCDVDIPDGKSYTLNLPEDGIIFPNGVFVSNTDNITAYTVYTEKYSGPYLTS